MSDFQRRAAEVDAAYLLNNRCYLLGSLEQGVTVYSQQLRAHNLAWALWMGRDRSPLASIGVVGGGIGGLTVASCLLSLFGADTKVTLFERLRDLAPLQQGSDTRWLHPRIYDWPRYGSRAPGASLPVLNWSEGRASDVARTVLHGFGESCAAYGGDERLTVFLDARLRVNTTARSIDYSAKLGQRSGGFFRLGRDVEGSEKFDCIVLACGFGLERASESSPSVSYWRNDQFAQPLLDVGAVRYLVSGAGDGALVDLCRLTVQRFRQDSILYELFGSDLDQVEEALCNELARAGDAANVYEIFEGLESTLLKAPITQLSNRLRKDTHVTLHIVGKSRPMTRFPDMFGPGRSVQNRLMTFLLDRVKGFSLSFEDPDEVAQRDDIAPAHVLRRYGADTAGHLRSAIVNHREVEARLNEMHAMPRQVARRLWQPGVFRRPS